MTLHGNVKNSQSVTSIFFECKRNDKSILKPTKWEREELSNQDLGVSSRTLPSLSQETSQPTNNFRFKEKILEKRYESYKSVLSKCHPDKIIRGYQVCRTFDS